MCTRLHRLATSRLAEVFSGCFRLTPSALTLFLSHAPSALVLFLKKNIQRNFKTSRKKNYASRLVASQALQLYSLYVINSIQP